MNLLYYDEWKNTDAVQLLAIFLDAVLSEFIYKIDNITKPIYSITKYKLDELKEIATILHLEYDNKYKKNNIYELIKEHLNNIIFF